MKTIGIINGPNLDRLGKREPEIYGAATLQDLENALRAKAKALDLSVLLYQSNHEGSIVDYFAKWTDEGLDAFIINPAAYSHTSVALHDAIKTTGRPTIEVHISNIHAREEFRKISITGAACTAVISGLGFRGYEIAMEELAAQFKLAAQ